MYIDGRRCGLGKCPGFMPYMIDGGVTKILCWEGVICILFTLSFLGILIEFESKITGHVLIKYQFSRAASSYFLLAWPRVHILCHFLTKIKKKYINLQKNHFKSIDQTCIFELQDIPFVEL